MQHLWPDDLRCSTEGCENKRELRGDRDARRMFCRSCRYVRNGKPKTWQNDRVKVRTRLFQERGVKCERCGFVHVEEGIFDAHHINGDQSDNRDENLVVLCKNCHVLTHAPNMAQIHRLWRYYRQREGFNVLTYSDFERLMLEENAEAKAQMVKEGFLI